MADETDEFEVKGQFLFCCLCRLNHDKGRKHIYSRKHKALLSKLLTKFGKKVDEARKFLKRPTVEDGELEPGSRFWCHFCHENANKHVTDRDVTIKFGGVFEHFASESHRKNLHTFWWENGADKSLKGKFLVDQKTFSSYKEEVDKKLKEFECQQELNRQKIVSQIKEKEVIQAHESQQVCLRKTLDEGHQMCKLNQRSFTKLSRMNKAFFRIPQDGMKDKEYGVEEL